MTYREFAGLMKAKRQLLLLTQRQMAEQLSVSPPAYCRMESGRQEPSFLQLQKICEILEIDLTEVFKTKKPNSSHKSYD